MKRKEKKKWQYFLVICPDFKSSMLAKAVTWNTGPILISIILSVLPYEFTL